MTQTFTTEPPLSEAEHTARPRPTAGPHIGKALCQSDYYYLYLRMRTSVLHLMQVLLLINTCGLAYKKKDSDRVLKGVIIQCNVALWQHIYICIQLFQELQSKYQQMKYYRFKTNKIQIYIYIIFFKYIYIYILPPNTPHVSYYN